MDSDEKQIDNRDEIGSLYRLAETYRDVGNYAAAVPLMGQILDILRVTLGEQHSDYANCLSNLAWLYTTMGDYAAAVPLVQQTLDIFRSTVGYRHPNYANSLNAMAELYRRMGNYASALPLYYQALDIVCTTLGERHAAYALSLNNLALVYVALGNYIAAESLLRQASVIDRNALGADHPDYASDLNNLAELYRTMGNYTAADPLYHQVLDIVRTTLGEQHPTYAFNLNNLAELYRTLGNYTAAESLYRQALAIYRASLGEEHIDYAVTLNNLALMYQVIGNYTAAELLMRQALDINLTTLGTQHPTYATSLSNLAILYQSTGNYEGAESLLRQALDIRRTTLGEQHPDYAVSLNSLAILHQATGDYTAAVSLLHQAATIDRKALGSQHPNYARDLNNLAELYKALGDYAHAEPLYHEICDIFHATLGPQHPDYALGLYNLATLFGATNRMDETLALTQQASVIQDKLIGQVFSIGSERVRMTIVANLNKPRDGLLSLVSHALTHDQLAVCLALDLVLRRKALGSEALAVQRDAVLGGRYPTLIGPLHELAMLREQFACATLNGLGVENPDSYRQRLTDAASQIDQLEEELARQIPEMNLEKQLRAADRRAVAAKLPPASALIEFVRFDVYNFTAVPARGEPQWQPAHYLAFVLLADAPDDVTMVELGEAVPIDHLLATFRQALTGEDADAPPDGVSSLDPSVPPVSTGVDRSHLRAAITATSRSMRPRTPASVPPDRAALGATLRQTILDPLLPALAGRTRLFLAPDGDLNRLPFEVLPLDDGRYLIDNYQISYLSVGRDALRFGATSTHPSAAPLVVADPDFDLGGHCATSFTPGHPFSPLAGTRHEGEQVARVLGIEPLLGAAALEQELTAQTSPRILHIATHGFFLPDPPHNPNRDQHAMSMDSLRMGSLFNRLATVENPLLRAGLALAGANTWLQEQEAKAAAGDGILNAVDVSGLALLSTELVVLSACETGLGSVQVGEGVFGLRRAFVLAGAKTLVMSLWKVPDRQTQELMELFYQHLLEGLPRADALRIAQLAIKERYPNPLYWGAFICQGEAGLLP